MLKGKHVILICFFVLSNLALFAQIEVVEHGPFTEMLATYTDLNRDDSRRLNGYRIQIIATTDRLRLEKAQRKFQYEYPYPVDWKHDAPYYKLRTGAFMEKADAISFLYKIKRTFPSAYPALVKDIKPSELLLYP